MDAIRFGTDGWRATLDQFTAPRVRQVAHAVATYLDDEGIDGSVIVGYDARDTSRGFAEEIARVICASGRDVLLPERDCPTPLVAWAIVDRGLAGGLMVTASHNPPTYNGVKFIPRTGAPALPDVTDAIEDRLAAPDPAPEEDWGRVRDVDVVTPHADHALELVDASLDGLTVAYDAMHGSGRGVTDRLLERAGAEVIPIRCRRDPAFGGSAPEPSPANLDPLVSAVDDADIGVANDGDADRIAVVTPDRGVLDANRLFAALYRYLLEDDSGPAVRSVSTTSLIDRIAAASGEDAIEVPVGFKWVAEAMATHDALIGGEESGGFSIRGHAREKDGVLLALLVAAAHGERSIDDRVDDVIAEFGDIHQDKVSVDCDEDGKARVLTAVREGMPRRVAGAGVAEVNAADGVKVHLDDGGWLLIRPSGTEPKLRLYAEADSEERVHRLLGAGQELVTPHLHPR